MWCYRRVLRITWMEKITNEEVLEKINCERWLINILESRKLKFIGHQLRKGYTLEKILLLGSVYGKRLRGSPKTRLSDKIKETCELTMVETEQKVQERTGWRRSVLRATAVRMMMMGGHFSGPCGFSAAKLASFCLI